MFDNVIIRTIGRYNFYLYHDLTEVSTWTLTNCRGFTFKCERLIQAKRELNRLEAAQRLVQATAPFAPRERFEDYQPKFKCWPIPHWPRNQEES